MAIFGRRPATSDTIEAASSAPAHSGRGLLTTIISGIALLFSGYSLWETSLKQADLDVYVTGVISYVRDTTADKYIQPSGGFEVLAVPVTIANRGAREGAVLSLQLDAKNAKTGLTARFAGTYMVDAAYFISTGAERPKTPFSALVIAGRSAWTGTVLFYPVSYSNGKALTPIYKVGAFNDELRRKYATEMDGASSISVLREKLPNLPELAELDAYEAKLLNQNDKIEVTLKTATPAPRDWLDRALGTQVQPVTLTLEMPDIPGDRVARGELVRLRTAKPNL
jgi:hypothetical protein